MSQLKHLYSDWLYGVWERSKENCSRVLFNQVSGSSLWTSRAFDLENNHPKSNYTKKKLKRQLFFFNNTITKIFSYALEIVT